MLRREKMFHVMFDIGGTLVKSMDFDSRLFVQAIEEELGHSVNTVWSKYKHVTDTGIIAEIATEFGRREDAPFIEERIKKKFLIKMEDYLDKNPTQEVEGASNFIDYLPAHEKVEVSIATGGWKESALMKLQSAGLFREAIPVATSNDHYSRVEIMKTAKGMMGSDSNMKCTYFGDAIWDKRACEELAYNFILVGDEMIHGQYISDFLDVDKALNFIGLT